MKKFSFFVAAASGLLSLAVSPSQGQIRILDDEQEQRRYERDRYSEPSDRDRYSDRYDGDGFASQYPAAEVQAVPMARARTAQARSELRQAENAVTAVLRNARLRFERSSEYQEALAEEKRAGTFSCIGCGTVLFDSGAKFESGTGWPSFSAPVSGAIETVADDSYLGGHHAGYGVLRTEVICATCGSHVGHLFNDGPPPTGQRFCANGIGLRFNPAAG